MVLQKRLFSLPERAVVKTKSASYPKLLLKEPDRKPSAKRRLGICTLNSLSFWAGISLPEIPLGTLLPAAGLLRWELQITERGRVG